MSEVISCKVATRKLELDGKKQQVTGCEVVCKDTVLFPEGGGQNTDKGFDLGQVELCLVSDIIRNNI